MKQLMAALQAAQKERVKLSEPADQMQTVQVPNQPRNLALLAGQRLEPQVCQKHRVERAVQMQMGHQAERVGQRQIARMLAYQMHLVVLR